MDDLNRWLARGMAGLLVSMFVVSDALADAWICTQGELIREVTIDYRAAPARLPCSVYYTKRTERALPRAVWKANSEEGFCERKAEELVAKLESWGWQCTTDPETDRDEQNNEAADLRSPSQ